MLRHLLTLLILSAALLAEAGEPRAYPVKVERATDADTLVVDVDLGFKVVLDDERLRLDGVQAPEMYLPRVKNKPPQVNPLGVAAKKYTVDWVARHGPGFVFIEAKGRPREKFGRLLGSLRAADGADLGVDLVKAGHAVRTEGGRR